MRKLHLIAGVAASLLLGACGGDKAGPDGNGDGDGGNNGGNGKTSFSATVSGDISKSLSGTAYYGDDAQTTGKGFGLGLGILDAGAKDYIFFVRAQTGRPATGSYPLADLTTDTPDDAEMVSVANFGMGTSDARVCLGTSGTLVVTSSAGERVKGTFTTELSCRPWLDQVNGEETNVTITGSYDAVKAVVPVPND